jgi:2-polyprenyl-3-methyl-5-hydroxy-6-metoxy-1,4-benzoquinol methylase
MNLREEMDRETVERLLALNRTFYACFAQSFADSRPASDPALVSILPYIPQGTKEPGNEVTRNRVARNRGCTRFPPQLKVLDVGCGNGRLATLLDRERPGATYVGVDATPELVEIARTRAAQLETVAAHFFVADVTQPGWSGELPGAPFDCAIALAVLHHIPSFELRAEIVRQMAGVLKPSGRLILSTWQFLASERLRRKIVPWAEVGIAEERLEAGDYLLDWKRGGIGLRYCHLVDETEVRRLAAEGNADKEHPLRVCETFRAGGREGNLGLFAVLDR